MKMTVKKNGENILERADVISVKDVIGAYEVIYEDETGQYVYKDDDVIIEIN